MKYLEWRNRMAFIICIAALIIMMFVFTKMLLSFSNTASFRFYLTIDTLAVQLYTSHYLGMFGTYTR